ncbi:MAG: SDR family NAD(P)-dependent oxidoreductase [Thermoflexaceae bacterium]|nr:SDR family NAD(P)-dependent oxidoreductase [Thermoflexaceae bacterium]
MKTLEGKVALVTGASRGIGEYVSLELGRAGAAVAVAARSEEVKDKRLPGTIHSVAQAIKDEGGQAAGIYMDMRDPESIAAGVAKTVELFGRVDIIVNNAAILVPGSIESIQPRHIDLIWQVDLRGPILLIREALPHLRAAGGGHIINVSSRAGVFPGPGPYDNPRAGGPFYGMVKAGLQAALSQSLAMELQSANISVNVLAPGPDQDAGNLFAENDPQKPTLEFERADAMAKGTRWICEQGPEFTGHILFDEDLCREKGL